MQNTSEDVLQCAQELWHIFVFWGAKLKEVKLIFIKNYTQALKKSVAAWEEIKRPEEKQPERKELMLWKLAALQS